MVEFSIGFSCDVALASKFLALPFGYVEVGSGGDKHDLIVKVIHLTPLQVLNLATLLKVEGIYIHLYAVYVNDDYVKEEEEYISRFLGWENLNPGQGLRQTLIIRNTNRVLPIALPVAQLV